MTFGPVVCAKLAADFEKWAAEAYALNDLNFSQMYNHIWATFGEADGTGMVTYPCAWYANRELLTEPKLGIESLALLESPRPASHDDDETDNIVREFDDI
jgi:hypothetical protein